MSRSGLSRPVTVRLSSATVSRLEREAAERGITRHEVILERLDDPRAKHPLAAELLQIAHWARQLANDPNDEQSAKFLEDSAAALMCRLAV